MFDKSAFESFIKDSATDGMSGVIVAPVENMKRLAIAITYGPLTTGEVLRRAASEVLPSSFIAGYVKPRGEGRSWNRLVRDFEVSDRAWGVEAAHPVPRLQIFVKTLTGETVMHFSPRRLGCGAAHSRQWKCALLFMQRGFMVAPDRTIEQVKEDIFNVENVPCDQQRLLYAGKQLEDDRSLLDYNIKNYSTLYLILCLRGGGGGPPLNFTGIDGNPVLLHLSNEVT